MDRLMTTDELAAAMRTTVSTVRWWRRNAYGPQGERIGRRVLYLESEVMAFVAERFGREPAGEGAA